MSRDKKPKQDDCPNDLLLKLPEEIVNQRINKFSPTRYTIQVNARLDLDAQSMRDEISWQGNEDGFSHTQFLTFDFPDDLDLTAIDYLVDNDINDSETIEGRFFNVPLPAHEGDDVEEIQIQTNFQDLGFEIERANTQGEWRNQSIGFNYHYDIPWYVLNAEEVEDINNLRNIPITENQLRRAGIEQTRVNGLSAYGDAEKVEIKRRLTRHMAEVAARACQVILPRKETVLGETPWKLVDNNCYDPEWWWNQLKDEELNIPIDVQNNIPARVSKKITVVKETDEDLKF